MWDVVSPFPPSPILTLFSITPFFFPIYSDFFLIYIRNGFRPVPVLGVWYLQSSHPSSRLLQFSIRAAFTLSNSSSQKGENTWQAGSQNRVVTNFTCNRFYTVILFSPLSLPNFGTPFSSLETFSITPLPPLRVNNNRFPSPIWCVIDFFCSLSILCVYFFDGGLFFFSITVSLEAYLRVILVVVLRSRCFADAVRVEEGLLSYL